MKGRIRTARGMTVALLLALLVAATLASVRFALVLFPLLVVFVGILLFRQSGATMAVVGWLLALALAVLYFHTGIDVALAASLYGVLRSFGITIAVMFTMLMVFLMREAGALEVISAAVRRVARTREEQAVFIGIGFGSFVTSLRGGTPPPVPPSPCSPSAAAGSPAGGDGARPLWRGSPSGSPPSRSPRPGPRCPSSASSR